MRRPVAAMLAASAMWGLAIPGTKYALEGFAPVTLLAVELLVAAGVLGVALVVRGYLRPSSWRRLALLAMFEPALAYLGETVGTDMTSAANASVLIGLESAFVVVLALLALREPVTLPLGAAVVVALVGSAVLGGDGGLRLPGSGDLVVLAGAMSAAAYTIVVKRRAVAGESLTLTAHQFALGALFVAPVAGFTVLSGREPLPHAAGAGHWAVAAIVGTGFGLAFLLFNHAIVTMGAGQSAVVVNLIPVWGVLGAVLLLREPFSRTQLLGAGLVAASVVVFSVAELRAGRVAPSRPVAAT